MTGFYLLSTRGNLDAQKLSLQCNPWTSSCLPSDRVRRVSGLNARSGGTRTWIGDNGATKGYQGATCVAEGRRWWAWPDAWTLEGGS